MQQIEEVKQALSEGPDETGHAPGRQQMVGEEGAEQQRPDGADGKTGEAQQRPATTSGPALKQRDGDENA